MMTMTTKRSECGVIATWLRRRSGGEEWEKVGGGGEGRGGDLVSGKLELACPNREEKEATKFANESSATDNNWSSLAHIKAIDQERHPPTRCSTTQLKANHTRQKNPKSQARREEIGTCLGGGR